MANKKYGIKSSAQDNFLEPMAPINVTATSPGAGRPFDNAIIVVSFELPANSPAATSYTATAYCSVHGTTHTATGSSSPLTISGNGSNMTTVAYVTASNAVGTSPQSAASNSVTTQSKPATPGAPSASSSSAGTDVVSWTAPANGGSAITNYHWISSDGKAGDTASTSISVAQEQGTGDASAARPHVRKGA